MVDVASEGAAEILEQWPGRFDLLQALPIGGLPTPLRCQVWEMRLRQYFDSIPLAEKLKSSESDALAWSTCQDAVAMVGAPALSSHILPMKEVICHLRSVHQGAAWSPLYLALTPLLAVALGAGAASDAGHGEDAGRMPASHGGTSGSRRAPWGSDRLVPMGAQDGRGMLRVVEAALAASGLADALLDPYSMKPKPVSVVGVGPGPDGGVGARTASAHDVGGTGGGVEWSAFVYAVSDRLHEMDGDLHDSLCRTLVLGAQQQEQDGPDLHLGGAPVQAQDHDAAGGTDSQVVQRALTQAWDLSPHVVAGSSAAVPRAHPDVRSRIDTLWCAPSAETAPLPHVAPKDSVGTAATVGAEGEEAPGAGAAGRGAGAWSQPRAVPGAHASGADSLLGAGATRARDGRGRHAGARGHRLLDREGGVLGALVLPLVQRLFVGVIGNFQVTLFLLDVLMTHGRQALPSLCATCLYLLRGPLQANISGTSLLASACSPASPCLCAHNVAMCCMARACLVHPGSRGRLREQAASSRTSAAPSAVL
jgi:hypothetical protein